MDPPDRRRPLHSAYKGYERPATAYPLWPDDGTWLQVQDQHRLLRMAGHTAHVVRVQEVLRAVVTVDGHRAPGENPVLVMGWFEGGPPAPRQNDRLVPLAERLRWIREPAALKHTHEKVGDRWEPEEQPGPSDTQAERGTPESRDRPEPTAQGVNANASKKYLMEVAGRLGIEHPERSTKDELVEQIEHANARATARARER